MLHSTSGVSPDTERALFACVFAKKRIILSLSSDRHLLITTRAIYNFDPNSYKKANRVLALKDLSGLILSSSSEEMLITVTNVRLARCFE